MGLDFTECRISSKEKNGSLFARPSRRWGCSQCLQMSHPASQLFQLGKKQRAKPSSTRAAILSTQGQGGWWESWDLGEPPTLESRARGAASPGSRRVPKEQRSSLGAAEGTAAARGWTSRASPGPSQPAPAAGSQGPQAPLHTNSSAI